MNSTVLSLGSLRPVSGNVNSMVKFLNKQLEKLISDMPTGMLQFNVKITNKSKAEETLKIITKEMFPFTQELRLKIYEDDVINVKIIQNKEESIKCLGSIPTSVYDFSSRVHHMIKQIWYKINFQIKSGIDLKQMYGVKIIIPIYDEETEKTVQQVVSLLSQDFEVDKVSDVFIPSETLEPETLEPETFEPETLSYSRLYNLAIIIKGADIEIKVVDDKVIELLFIF